MKGPTTKGKEEKVVGKIEVVSGFEPAEEYTAIVRPMVFLELETANYCEVNACKWNEKKHLKPKPPCVGTLYCLKQIKVGGLVMNVVILERFGPDFIDLTDGDGLPTKDSLDIGEQLVNVEIILLNKKNNKLLFHLNFR